MSTVILNSSDCVLYVVLTIYSYLSCVVLPVSGSTMGPPHAFINLSTPWIVFDQCVIAIKMITSRNRIKTSKNKCNNNSYFCLFNDIPFPLFILFQKIHQGRSAVFSAI